MIQLDPVGEALLQSPPQLLRLHQKVTELLTVRTKDNSRVVAPAFETVDGRHKRPDERVDWEALFATVRRMFPLQGVTDRELRVLLRMISHAEEEGGDGGGVDPVMVFLALRRMLPAAAWQLWYVVCKARTAVFRSDTMSGLELHLRDVLAGHPVEPVRVPEAVAFLVSGGGLSASEAHIVAEYCIAVPEPLDRAVVDAPLMHGLLFSERIPSTVEYPILAARFAEATAETARAGSGATGTLALIEALSAALSLPLPRADRTAEEVMDEPDIDYPARIMEACLTGRQFFDVCRRIGVGFPQEQSDQLYYYLTDEPGTLSGRSVVQLYRQYFPSVGISHFQVVQAAVRAAIVKSGDPLAFFSLYSRLAEWGAGPVPIDAYVAAVRRSGVAQAAVSDLAVEWLRLKAATRVDLVLLLCNPVPPSREAVVRKLYERLDAQQHGGVLVSEMLGQFRTDRIEGEQVRGMAARWRSALETYVAEVEERLLSYELFAFFWYMISAAVADDPTYTMVVWQGFSLAERRAVRR